MTTTDQEPIAGTASSVVPSFLAELTRAMQAAAEQQRGQIAAVVAEDAAGQVEHARRRGAVEAEELRRLAEEDVAGIEAWAADETERIRQEAGRRKDERRRDLEAHLTKHETIIATEIDGVGEAIREYNTTLDQFFDGLRAATNPADIARQAGSLPAPPDLESVRGLARASAVAKFANAPHEEADATEGEVPATAVENPPVASVAAGQAAEPAAHEGLAVMDPAATAGHGVMDPAANGRPGELPVDAVARPVPEDAVAAASAQHSSAATRLLRTIAPWTLTEQDDDHPGTEGP